MNPDQLATLWATLWPIITAVVAVASTLDASLPQPAAGSHWLLVRKVVSFLAVNVGNASNGCQPSFVTWIIRIATPVLQAQGQMPAAVAPPAPAPTPSATTVVGALLAGLLLTGGLSACATSATSWTPIAAADVVVNAALAAEADLRIIEAQLPGAQTAIKTAGAAIAAAAQQTAAGMVAGTTPLVLTEQGAIALVTAAAPNLQALVTTKTSGSGQTVTSNALADIGQMLLSDINYLLPAVANADAGTTTVAQLQADEALLVSAADAL